MWNPEVSLTLGGPHRDAAYGGSSGQAGRLEACWQRLSAFFSKRFFPWAAPAGYRKMRTAKRDNAIMELHLSPALIAALAGWLPAEPIPQGPPEIPGRVSSVIGRRVTF
jgi:hypothetical protein